MQLFLEKLQLVAHEPLTYVAFVVLVGAWLWREYFVRTKDYLVSLKTLPKRDQLSGLQLLVLGYPQKVTANQLKLLQQRYFFMAFVATLVCIVILAGLTSYYWSLPAEEIKKRLGHIEKQGDAATQQLTAIDKKLDGLSLQLSLQNSRLQSRVADYQEQLKKDLVPPSPTELVQARNTVNADLESLRKQSAEYVRLYGRLPHPQVQSQVSQAEQTVQAADKLLVGVTSSPANGPSDVLDQSHPVEGGTDLGNTYRTEYQPTPVTAVPVQPSTYRHVKEDADKKEERVEIKYLVPENKIADVSKNLSLDAEHPTETRVVCFYDTSLNTLFKHTPRVILRSRYAADGTKTDTTVKIRGAELRGGDVECESDQVIGKPPAESCSLTDKKQPVDEIMKANAGNDVKKIFNYDQEEFVKKAGVDLDWENLVPFGPVEGVKVWKNVSAQGLEKMTVERWELPERDRKPKRVLFEVSTKVPVSQESEATAALAKAVGITSTEEQEQETKTKVVLDHFAGNHPARP